MTHYASLSEWMGLVVTAQGDWRDLTSRINDPDPALTRNMLRLAETAPHLAEDVGLLPADLRTTPPVFVRG